MVAHRSLSLTLLLIVLSVPRASAAPPKVLLEEWKEACASNPKLFEVGVYAVDQPEKGLVATGRVSRERLSLDTQLGRETAADLAELAAKKQLLDFAYRRDRGDIKLPAHLEKYANEALKREAHGRAVTLRGVQVLARWIDAGHVWCTLVIAQSNMRRVGEIAADFRLVGSGHYLRQYAQTQAPADLFRAFEIDPHSNEIRSALAHHLLGKGCRVAAFCVSEPKAALPGAKDALARYLAGTPNPSWEKALAHFEAEKPDLPRALDAFLMALETRYANADSFNYVGACFRTLGWPRLASVFFERSLAQAEGGIHRFALTNLGLCLEELDQADAARPFFRKAVQSFPDEGWTANARKALERLDAK